MFSKLYPNYFETTLLDICIIAFVILVIFAMIPERLLKKWFGYGIIASLVLGLASVGSFLFFRAFE